MHMQMTLDSGMEINVEMNPYAALFSTEGQNLNSNLNVADSTGCYLCIYYII